MAHIRDNGGFPLVATACGSRGAVYYITTDANGVVSCTCMSWRFMKTPIETRVCKHIEQEMTRFAAQQGQVKGKLPDQNKNDRVVKAARTRAKAKGIDTWTPSNVVEDLVPEEQREKLQSFEKQEEVSQSFAVIQYGTEMKYVRPGMTVAEAFRQNAAELGLDEARAAVYRCKGQLIGPNEVIEPNGVYTASIVYTASPASESMLDAQDNIWREAARAAREARTEKKPQRLIEIDEAPPAPPEPKPMRQFNFDD